MFKPVSIFGLSLLSVFIYMVYSIVSKPYYHEGPLVNKIDSANVILVRHFVDDGIRIKQVHDTLPFNQQSFEITDKESGEVYKVEMQVTTSPTQFQGVEKILVLGNAHYRVELGILEVLKANGVLDEQNNWKWGSGHLVILGNVIHHSSKLIDELWQLYKIDQQAQKVGGYLHLVLGPNELNVLNVRKNKIGENSFQNDKLTFLKKQKDSLYVAGIFNKGSVFGDWLRSKNVIVKINEYLFCHGGLTGQAQKEQLDLEYINQSLQVNMRDEQSSVQKKYLHWLHNPINPVLYKGYYEEQFKQIKGFLMNTEDIQKVLQYYNTIGVFTTIIPLRQTTTIHNHKVYTISPIWEGKDTEVVLIEGGTVFKMIAGSNRKVIQQLSSLEELSQFVLQQPIQRKRR